MPQDHWNVSPIPQPNPGDRNIRLDLIVQKNGEHRQKPTEKLQEVIVHSPLLLPVFKKEGRKEGRIPRKKKKKQVYHIEFSREKKIVFTAFLVVGLFFFAETCSYVAFPVITAKWFSPSALSKTKSAIVTEASAAEMEMQSAPEADQLPDFMARERVHPFLGYVSDTVLSMTGSSAGFEFKNIVKEASSDTVVIGIFGGSVSQQFGNNGVATLQAELKKDPRFAGKIISVVGMGMGGYKQPQQLIALNYLLSLGAHFDMVLNIDGFNEVALAPTENVPAHVSPFFPRSWSQRVEHVEDLDVLRLIGEKTFVRDNRASWASFFNLPIVRFSPTANLVWYAGDAEYQSKLFRTEQNITRTTATEYASGAVLSPVSYKNDKELLVALVSLWKRSSLQMKEISEANGIRYFHFLQPNQYFTGSKVLTNEERTQSFNTYSPYKPWVEKGYPLMRDAGNEMRKEGERFYDLTGLFAKTRETIYRDNCCHLNQDGNETLGKAIAAAVLRDW